VEVWAEELLEFPLFYGVLVAHGALRQLLAQIGYWTRPQPLLPLHHLQLSLVSAATD
jgi:hypothetical protein